MPLRAKQVTFFAAKLLLSAGVLVYLVRRLDLDQLRSNLFAIDPWTFLLGLALVGLQTAILNGRWMLIMRSLGVSIEWLAGMRILLISLWFNQVLPSSAGGDVVRIWLLRRRGVQWSQAVKGVMADRFTALLGLVALMVVGLPFLVMRVHNSAAELAIGGLAVAGVAGTLFLLTLDRWPARIIALGPIGSFVRFGTLIRFLLLRFGQRGLLFGSAILIHLMTAASCYVLATGLQTNLSVLDALIFFPPVILLTAVPISISGWGVREGAMVACLGLAGVSPAKALAISLLMGAISVIIGVVGGIVWLASPERGKFTAAQAVAMAEDASGPLLDGGLAPTSDMPTSP
jgi:glycosyltransferase 2 family protein